MINTSSIKYRSLLIAVIAAMTLGSAPSAAAPAKRKTAAAHTSVKSAQIAQLPAGTQRPTKELLLSIGEGQLVNLPTNVSDVWTSNPGAADVYVKSARQIYVFGKDFGEATIFATSASGQVVYSTNVRVSQNITSIDRVLKLAMPDADIVVTTVGQMAILTGTVKTPDDAEQAERIVKVYLNPGIKTESEPLKILVISRLRTATPLQVNLQVRIAEVSRTLVKEIGSNLLSRDQTGGFLGGIAQGRNFGSIGTQDISGLPLLDASTVFGLPANSIRLPFDPTTGQFITRGGTAYNFANLGQGAGKTALGLAGRLFGVDVAAALDLAEREGLVTTLAQPNLTALSGETANFLAGGEIPVPLVQGDSRTVTVEYKPYGVSLAFTPTVLADGRISMRVRPEVSDLTQNGAIQLNGFTIPALSTRRTETTVEMGSGQSFMIGGLLQNTHNNSFDRAPGLGNVPVLGALFRSNAFRRAETELVIIVTPYLVKPVNANEIVLPTDGYKAANDAERILLGRAIGGASGGDRPKPSMAPPSGTAAPLLGAYSPPAAPAQQQQAQTKRKKSRLDTAAATPGFSGK